MAIYDGTGKVLASYTPLEDFTLVVTAVDAKNDRLLLGGMNQPFPVKMLVPFTAARAAAALEVGQAPPAKPPAARAARPARPKKAR